MKNEGALMGIVEDVRKIVQDLVAPDLKEIKAKLEGLEKRMDERFAAAEKRMDERFAAAENLAAERHNQVLVEIRRTQDVTSLWSAVRAIQEKLEQKMQ